MSLITAAALASGLLVPAEVTPPPEHSVILALNPQPEPPGKAKVKRVYSGGPDSRRNRNIKTNKQLPNQVAPAAKY